MSKVYAPGLIIHAMFILGACGPKIARKNLVEPSEIENRASTGNSADGRSIYSRDESYKQNPEMWLGKVAFARKGGASCRDTWLISWEGAIFGPMNADKSYVLKEIPMVAGFKTTTRSAPELRASAIVNQRIAAKVDALSYLSAELSGKSIYEIVVTDITAQRIETTPQWEDAKSKYRQDERSRIDAADVCAVFTVSGFTHKTIVKKLYTTTSVRASGGYAGINVDGSYYNESRDYRLDHLFQLSVDYLRAPPADIPQDLAAKLATEELTVIRDEGDRTRQQQRQQQMQQQQQQQLQQQH